MDFGILEDKLRSGMEQGEKKLSYNICGLAKLSGVPLRRLIMELAGGKGVISLDF